MQRITGLASCRALGGLRPWRRRPACGVQPAVEQRWAAGSCVRPARPFTGEAGARGRRVVFAGQKHRAFSAQPGADGPPGNSEGRPAISVVGIPDPITWIRCKVVMYLIKLCFELDVSSEEFDRGVKQALVHVSSLMSSGRYHRLVGIVSAEMAEYVEQKCRSLTDDQRQQLAVAVDDIVFTLPEDVSVVFDQYGRKFCIVVMRFWLLTTHEGPDDPEGTKIFKVASGEDGHPQRKVATAVYEFRRELTKGASADWTVTTVWHWQWKAAE